MTMDIEKDDLLNESNIGEYNKSTGLSVAWKNLIVTVKQVLQAGLFQRTTYTYKNILRDVSGAIKSETLVAILGASGSGKSTLMSVLANRQAGGLQVHGKITIGGTQIGPFTRYVSGFVYQDDLFLPVLTVTEHLNFMAKLRVGRDMTEKARRTLINEIMSQLGLSKVANDPIGSSAYGYHKLNLSGGEAKRLSIATELITDPCLLFCDEPTTGLDSYTAFKVVANLRELVDRKHKTIICSVHQPNEQIFEQFDQIILMSGGRIAFSGSKTDAISFFESNGYTLSEEQNPADFLIQSLANEAGVTSAEEFCSKYENSEYYSGTLETVEKEMSSYTSSGDILSAFRNLKEPRWFSKLFYVSHRSWISVYRDKGSIRVRLAQKLVLGLLFGFCLRNTITWTQSGLQGLRGALWFMIIENFHPAIFSAADFLPKYLPIFFREYSSNTVTPLTFYLATAITMEPVFAFGPVLLSTIIYFMSNLPGTITTFFMTWMITIIVSNVSAAFGILISIAIKNMDMVLLVVNPLNEVALTCCGIFVKLSSIPTILKWVRYVSWFTMGVESLFIVHLCRIDHIECYSNPELPCLKNGLQVLESYDYHVEHLLPNIVQMLSICLFLHFLAYLTLLHRIRSA